MSNACTVRSFEPSDAPQLLALMRDLARFEDYLDDFAATEADLLAHGFGKDALFHALVADEKGRLIGMAVTYVVPWTYTRRPRLVLKELFVAANARDTAAGRALMLEVVKKARTMNADHIAWTVMQGNTAAERFYDELGGRPDRKWENWRLDL